MKKKKIFVMASTMVITAAALTGIHAGTVFAAEGWNNEGGIWTYLDRGDVPVKNTWKSYEGSTYYLDADGVMATNCLIGQGESLYYVDSTGARARNQWVLIQADDGQEHKPGWYYFGSDGRAYRGSGNSFKRQIEGKTYIFDENGVMLTGLLDENGRPLDDETDPFLAANYYAGEDGALYTNEWYRYDGFESGEGKSEASGRYYSEYPAIWLRFNSNGVKLKAEGAAEMIEKKIDGAVYGFDSNGVMINGFVKNADSDITYFSEKDGGAMFANSWYWLYPSQEMDEKDYYDQECSWFYAGGSGKVYRNKITNVRGRKYAFDKIGRMQTGFVFFGDESGNRNFVKAYEVDQLSSDNFKEGPDGLPPVERADLYLFSPNELNDGSMQTGDRVDVQLADGAFTFGFRPNGKAYGNGNLLERRNDSYYINGLLLKPASDDEYGYGVVGSRKGGVTKYKLVDAKGKVVDGQKKVIKSKSGDYILLINDEFKAMVSTEEKPRWATIDGVTGFYEYDKDSKKCVGNPLATAADTDPTGGLSDLLLYEGEAR